MNDSVGENTDALLKQLIAGQGGPGQEAFLEKAGQRKGIYLDEPIESPISEYQVMTGFCTNPPQTPGSLNCGKDEVIVALGINLKGWMFL